MITNTVADAAAMNDRLVVLLGKERLAQVDFLVALAHFAERRLYLDLGFATLWEYCIRALHLREGATFLRTHAVGMLRRFPTVEEHLRDGRLCLSTLVELESILDERNLSEVLAREAWRTKT